MAMTFRPVSRRTRIETEGPQMLQPPPAQLSGRYPEEQGLKPEVSAIGRRDSLPFRPVSRRTRIETMNCTEEDCTWCSLSGRYPEEQGLKPAGPGEAPERTAFRPVSRRTRIETLRQNRKPFGHEPFRPVSRRTRIETWHRHQLSRSPCILVIGLSWSSARTQDNSSILLR